MSTPPPLTSIALVGATGNLGPHILHALYTHPSNYHLTILTRTKNKPQPLPFPSSIKIIHPNDNDDDADGYTPDFLHRALSGIDAVVLAVNIGALGEQKKIIDACARVGVRRVVVSEFGSDTTNALTVGAVPPFKAKVEVVEYAKKVVAEQQPEGVLSWSAVVTGPFYDWCLKLGVYGIDVNNKKATLYDEGKGEFTTTTLTQIGASVASLLAHPTKNANSYVFISSFTTSQAAIFSAVKAASGTKTADWTIENKSVEAYMQEGREKAAQGDVYGTYNLIFGTVFGGSKYGSDYGNRREISNKELGLEEEDLESVTKEVLEGKRPRVEW